MINMKKVDTGTFQLDLSQLPSLKILPRAISNRATEVEVFVVDGEILLYAKDLSGNVSYIAQEQGADIKMFSIVDQPAPVIIEEDEEEDSVLLEISETLDDEIDDNFLDFLSELETVNEPLLNEGEDLSEIKEEVDTVRNKPKEYCHFATSTDLLQVLAELEEIEMVVKEDEIVISSMEKGIISKFDRIKAYSEIEDIMELLALPTWEDFPINKVKSIIPVIEQIEEATYRQFLSLKDGKMYTFSDIIAVESESGHMGRNYNLNSEVLRVLKYSTAKDTDIKISELENGSVCLNIDRLSIFFGPSGEYGENLFEIPRQVTSKKPFIGAITKDFIDKVKMIKKIYKDRKNIIIEAKDDAIVLRNDKVVAIASPAGKVHEGVKVVVDIDKLLLAIRIADNRNAGFSLYEITEHRATIIVEGNVDVLIDTEEYYKEGDFGYDEI